MFSYLKRKSMTKVKNHDRLHTSGLQHSSKSPETTTSRSGDTVGALIPREPVISIGVDRVGMNIKDLISQLPKITPPSNPQLCMTCSTINFLSLLSSNRTVSTVPEAGTNTATVTTKYVRLVLSWDCPQESFKQCPMCRLLACDKVWRSGISPYNQYFKGYKGEMQIEVELSSGTEVKLSFAAQSGMEKDTGQIEVFALNGSYAASSIRGRPWNGFTAKETVQTIQNWAQRCDAQHKSCGKRVMGTDSLQQPVLPSRVLFVGSLANPELRLHVTHGARGKYLALSHCWGAVLHIKTMKATLNSHLQSIKEEQLSRLLRDAVQITRLIGHQYVWIDALCIIQDDAADWEREAAQMGSVYENAYLTLAATDGRDGDYSLLDPEHDIFVDKYVVEYPCSSDPDQRSIFFKPKQAPETDQPCIDASPLNKRAWVTQERILSRRILHYAQGMIYWECDSKFEGANGTTVGMYLPATIREQLLTVNMESPITESSYDTEAPGPISQDSKNFWKMYMRLTYIWSDIISNYNKCALTRDEDKLPAVSGLAKSIEDRTGLFYHCGLFFDKNEMVPRQLLWMPSSDALRYTGEAPSWSWASCTGPVEIWDSQADFFDGSGWFPEVEADFVATIKKFIPPHESDPVEFPTEVLDPTRMGAILMEGQPALARRNPSRDFNRKSAFADGEAIKIPLHEWPRPFDCNERSYAVYADPWSPNETQKFKGWVCFDTDSYEPEMFCVLPIVKKTRLVMANRSTTGKATEYVVWRFLAVQRCTGRRGAEDLAFQRVGYGEVFGRHHFDGKIKSVFTLV